MLQIANMKASAQNLSNHILSECFRKTELFYWSRNQTDHYDIKEKKLAERVATFDTDTIKANSELFKGKGSTPGPASDGA